ncbi:hypothetical protein [Sphingobium algorifonticola]|uniref:Transmembrane protein n=1 Tax=Sphingobium algorifonticola TaxID=2008318 RepID=A0A437J4P1_9SPHN|nr:hypothetical protein [Sphingobium algorifonticola]RVT39650.1 hypothetical protein ENE74_14940 [Sphingobium algorifonticola]
MLLVGAMFILTAHTVDPLKNCDEGGNCASWLVPIAGIIGWSALAMALGLLVVNPNRGCRIDSLTGDLLWWQDRTLRSEGNTGRIHPSRIARIRVDLRGDSDSVSLYDVDGERLAWFDETTIPWPYDRWAARFHRAYPHILLDKLE